MTAYVDIELKALREHINKLSQENKDLKVQIESMRNRPASLQAADNTIEVLRKKLAEARGDTTYTSNKESYDQLRKERDIFKACLEGMEFENINQLPGKDVEFAKKLGQIMKMTIIRLQGKVQRAISSLYSFDPDLAKYIEEL
jgi:predicted RNase H-like nuclease (RuvC/YqgF family)